MARITKKQLAEQELEERRIRLREMLPPGSIVYTKLDHVSRSGMYRVISLYTIKDNEMVWLSRLAAPLLQGYDEKHEGCKAGGCGMDMGFHLVYSLSYQLYPNGFDCIGDKCSSNDHFNRVNNAHHRDGGYALEQRWM